MPAALEDMQRAHQVAVDVHMRIGHRMTNTRLRSQVHDPVDALILEQRFHARTISQVELGKAEAILSLQTRQARLLQVDVVVVVQVVETEHLITPGQQARCDKVTDETRRSGDENPHHMHRSAYSRPSTSSAGSMDLIS